MTFGRISPIPTGEFSPLKHNPNSSSCFYCLLSNRSKPPAVALKSMKGNHLDSLYTYIYLTDKWKVFVEHVVAIELCSLSFSSCIRFTSAVATLMPSLRVALSVLE